MTDAADAPRVLTERRGEVLVITINREQARNSIDQATAEGIAAAIEELDGSDDLRVGILTGAGGGFSAGMDLKALVRGEGSTVEGRGWAGITRRPRRSR